MFTGIVREVGRLVSSQGTAEGRELVVSAPGLAAGAGLGDSIAVDGTCLTVTAIDGAHLSFHAGRETLARTTLTALAVDEPVNLEPALRAGEPLGGHIVQGHVDEVGAVQSVEAEGEGLRVIVEASQAILRYCVEKGSITVDGVSLTVAELYDDCFGIALIPHTLEVTTLGTLVPGRRVNLEVDVLAKYVERLLPR
ncbi:MAG: riboflavin synthase [Gaiella sp.]